MSDQMSVQMSVQMSDLSVLFRAAVLGDEQALLQWLTTQPDETTQPDTETILGNILRTSALLGHVLFTEFLLNHNHKLAVSADSSGRTSLHLTSAEGNLLIVRRLLLLNNELCLVRDEEQRIPVHYAAMRGRTEVVQELILAKPDSVSLGDGEERTVFHLCVIYNHLQTLETLVKLDYAAANIAAGEPRPYNFLRPDRAGDTILHLASKFKRVEVVSYLLSIPEVREIANFKNNTGFTAHDILQEQSPKDFKICEIHHMLTMFKREENFSSKKRKENFCKKIFRDWLTHGDEWLEEMRGNLSLVSTVIATITFQALINPPGGFIDFVEGNTTSLSNQVLNTAPSPSYDLSCPILPDNHEYCPGQAMASYSHNFHSHFPRYLFHVTISFISSLSVTLLLVSGIFPLKNKAVIWMLSMGMCITLTSLAAAFVNAMHIIIPHHLWSEGLISTMTDENLYQVWVSLILIIVVSVSLRFFVWALKKSRSLWARKNGCGRFLSVLLGIISLLATLFAPLLVLILIVLFLIVR